jgi:hypothetical protein
MNVPGKLMLPLLAGALPVLAADSLNVKPGLWETTTVTSSTGMPALPKEMMDQLPPAQKAQMESAMKQMGIGAPSTRTDTSCVTAEDLKKGTFAAAQENQPPGCKFEEIQSTAKHQEMAMSCNGQMQATGRMVVDAVDSGNVRGQMDIKSAMVTMNIKFTSRWLSAACEAAGKK